MPHTCTYACLRAQGLTRGRAICPDSDPAAEPLRLGVLKLLKWVRLHLLLLPPLRRINGHHTALQQGVCPRRVPASGAEACRTQPAPLIGRRGSMLLGFRGSLMPHPTPHPSLSPGSSILAATHPPHPHPSNSHPAPLTPSSCFPSNRYSMTPAPAEFLAMIKVFGLWSGVRGMEDRRC